MMIRRTAVGMFVLLAFPSLGSAELTQWKVTSKQPYAGGKACGDRGPYELWKGKVEFAVDPDNPANQDIVDLPLAPRNPGGEVEFSADFELLVPADRSQANGTVFYEVNNRGTKTAPGIIDQGAEEFLCRKGYVVLWSGWIAETFPGDGRLRLQAPYAIENGRRIRGRVRNELVVDRTTPRASIAHRGNQGSFPPVPELLETATVTRRPAESSPRLVIPRELWQLHIREFTSGQEVAQLPLVELEVQGGLQAGWIYEICYEAEGSLVQGCGLASIRDLISSLKFGQQESKNPLLTSAGKPLVTHAIGFGTSQSGRCLRQFVWQGFNADERGRKVFDGVISHVAGAGLGSFNHRFASPTRTNGQHEEHLFPADYFPFTYGEERDPYTQKEDGILRRAIATDSEPKLFHTQSSSEYWHRAGSLVHTSPLSERDADIPASVRIYALGGTQHGPGSGIPAAASNGTLPGNPADYRPFMRALIVAMSEWIVAGTEPPASCFPRIADETLVDWHASATGWPSIPGVDYPQVIHTPHFLRRGPEWESRGIATLEPPQIVGTYVVRVPAMDEDGNERGVLKLPALKVPVATYTSWNLRRDSIGAAGALWALQGGYVPFAKTRREREAAQDPRRSLQERYSSYDDYEQKYMAAAQELLEQRYLLAEELPRLNALCRQFRDLW